MTNPGHYRDQLHEMAVKHDLQTAAAAKAPADPEANQARTPGKLGRVAGRVGNLINHVGELIDDPGSAHQAHVFNKGVEALAFRLPAGQAIRKGTELHCPLAAGGFLKRVTAEYGKPLESISDIYDAAKGETVSQLNEFFDPDTDSLEFLQDYYGHTQSIDGEPTPILFTDPASRVDPNTHRQTLLMRPESPTTDDRVLYAFSGGEFNQADPNSPLNFTLLVLPPAEQ